MLLSEDDLPGYAKNPLWDGNPWVGYDESVGELVFVGDRTIAEVINENLCQYCQKVLTGKRHIAKTCSASCREMLSRRKRRANPNR